MQETYTPPVKVCNQIEVFDEGISLIKEDLQLPDEEHFFSNPHDQQLEELFNANGIERYKDRDHPPVSYIYKENGKKLVGSVVWAGENHCSIDPWITLQKLEVLRTDTPVNIFRVRDRMYTKVYDLDWWVMMGSRMKRNDKFMLNRVDTNTLTRKIRDVYSARSFPAPQNDPFLIVGRQLYPFR